MFDNIFMLLVTKEKLCKDDTKSGKFLHIYCSHNELELVFDEIKVYMLKATYSLVKSDAKLVCDWLKNSNFLIDTFSTLEIVSILANVPSQD